MNLSILAIDKTRRLNDTLGLQDEMKYYLKATKQKLNYELKIKSPFPAGFYGSLSWTIPKQRKCEKRFSSLFQPNSKLGSLCLTKANLLLRQDGY